MSMFHDTKQKLRNIERTIDALLDSDFPVDSGKDALRDLKQVFFRLGGRNDRAQQSNDESTLRATAKNLNDKIILLLPILGFILRSTNVRNAFELLDPLQYIANRALDGTPKLLLSSEWDYVPFAYPQSLDDLKNFILIGLPASEAGSALLAPLAGHELGHAVWRNLGIEPDILPVLQGKARELCQNAIALGEYRYGDYVYNADDLVSRSQSLEDVSASVFFAVCQAEEIFCDLFAYSIFGESYIYAFSYILAPGFSTMRSLRYPTNANRLRFIRAVARNEGVELPTDIDLAFDAEDERTDPRERFIVGIADKSVSCIVNSLWEYIVSINENGKVCRPSSTNSDHHLSEIRIGIPTCVPASLGDIVNAGWKYYHELQNPDLKLAAEELSEKFDTLNEILLKSVEVLEFRRRTLEE